ncbi:hypothetical protein FRB90_009285 [Tulasnella sp. 427]|nr:hypothetical protein FRB90_009285 [Tulasnella sp. 427]
MKQSIPNVTRTTRFISRTVILPLTSGETDVTARHFSFRLPIRDDSDMGMIPPTFYATSADLQVEVRYALIVTLTRRGLRKDDSLITPFGYFPEASGSRNPQLVQSPNGTLRNPIQIQSLHPSTQSSDNSEYDVVATLEADPSESPTTWITLNKQVVVVQDGQKFQASRQLTRVPNCMVAYSDGCWKLRGRLKVPSNAVSQSWSFAGVTVLYVIRIQARCKSRGSVETYVHTHPLLGPLPPLPGNRDAAPGE